MGEGEGEERCDLGFLRSIRGLIPSIVAPALPCMTEGKGSTRRSEAPMVPKGALEFYVLIFGLLRARNCLSPMVMADYAEHSL